MPEHVVKLTPGLITMGSGHVIIKGCNFLFYPEKQQQIASCGDATTLKRRVTYARPLGLGWVNRAAAWPCIERVTIKTQRYQDHEQCPAEG